MEATRRTMTMTGILVAALAFSPLCQWVQTAGLYGGDFEALTTNDSVLCASVFGRGVFRTVDGGKSWTSVSDGLAGRDIFSLASVGNELFAGTENNGLHLLSGGSGSWSRFEPESGATCNRIASMTARGNEIWAATGNGLVVLRKKNGKWIDSLVHRLYWSQALAVTNNLMFVSSGSLLERSTDRGATWAACTTGLPQAPISCLVMLDDTLGFIGTEEGPYGTRNGGVSWSVVNGGTATDGNFSLRGFAARNDTVLYASSDKLWLSIDRGKTWADFTVGRTFTGPRAIGLIGSSVFLATSKGIFKSSFSDRNWIDISAGIVSGRVTAMLKAGGAIFAGCDANGKLYRSDDNGMNWAVSDSGFDFSSTVHALALFDSMLFAGCDYQGLMQSTDLGRSWAKVDFKTSTTRSFIERDGALLMGQYTAGIQSLAVRGAALQDANAGIDLEIPDCGCSAPYPTPLAFTAVDSAFFVSLEDHGIFSSPAPGAIWRSVNSGLSDTIVKALYTTNGILLAGTRDNGIFRSTNRGTSWSGCKTDLSGLSVSAFAGKGTTTFAGTGNGVYFSIDSGASWNKWGTAFNDSVLSLLVDGDHLLAGTASRGVWRRPVAEVKVKGAPPQIGNEAKPTFVDLQKRGAILSCTFSLSHREWVTIKLYDIRGKMIKVLERSLLSPGEHVIESSLSKMRPGCYVIRLEGESMYRGTSFISFRRL